MRNKGYTIVEIVVVMTLAGAALAIATPSLPSAYRRTAVRSAVDEYMSTHSLARAAAVRYGRTAELHVDSNGRFWVEVDTSSTGGVTDTVGVVKNLSDEGVALTDYRSIVCFDSRGVPTTRGACEPMDATMIFSSKSLVDTVTVTVLGRVLR